MTRPFFVLIERDSAQVRREPICNWHTQFLA